MADQPTPALPPDGRSYVSTPPPAPSTRVPSSSEMAEAGRSGAERGASVAQRAEEYARGYDRPAQELSRPGEPSRLPEQAQPPGERRYTLGEGDRQISLSADEIEGLITRAAQEATIRNTIKSPADLRVEPSANFKPPPGYEFAFDPNDPMGRAAQEWAFKHGIGQEKLSELVDIYAAQRIQKAQEFNKARDQQIAELGTTTAGQRVDAVYTWLKGSIGEEYAKELAEHAMYTAKSVQALEQLMMKVSNGGVGQFNNVGREPNHQRGPSDSEWQAMDWNSRRNYQRQFADSQQQQRRR